MFKHGHEPIIEVATSENGDVIRCESTSSLMSARVHAQQGKDHLPPTNTYLLYALPLKSL